MVYVTLQLGLNATSQGALQVPLQDLCHQQAPPMQREAAESSAGLMILGADAAPPP